MTQQWTTEISKKLHQARIDENLKEYVRALSILDRTSISDVTEQALRNHIDSNQTRLSQYYIDQSKLDRGV